MSTAVNGVAVQALPPFVPPPAANAEATAKKFTPAKLREIDRKLRQPFPPELISWKPQVVSYKGENSTAMGAAYADNRAYTDRLNQVAGSDGWSQSVVLSTSSTYEKEVKKKEKNPETGAWDIETSKILRTARISAVVTVTINGLGSHSNVGESDIADENATTSAYAQGFKRACTEFGLGRYLYDLPATGWLPYDTKSKKFKTEPQLPDWAIPREECMDCRGTISAVTTKDGTAHSVEQVIARSTEVHGRQLCGKCHLVASKKMQERAGKANIGVPAPGVAA